ncbi:uncharacterized protein LOC129573918 isoform X2 [Sitodiplosis mosellana]|uniref:uncharacterized protein LOC129573918 isoform X2 n=1 Tax=Sitodiplosis mosellana TaxID=263140 RepID=UPI002444BF28|nr:uncharacterized protein LOC129573918 isoform X2 [Sitodiplosis mosellana]
MIWCILLTCTFGLGFVSGDPIVRNTTVAATNIESTIGTPALLVDPTLTSSQNTTDGQYETILKITPFSNSTAEPDETTTYLAITDLDIDLTELIEKAQQNTTIAPASALRRPCECHKGVCGCCTGMLFSALRQLGCMNITYHPDDFSFEFKMIMNNAVLYKNRVTGRNPPPVCVRMPRFSFVKVCANFYDLHFIGRNMHVCMEMSAFFQDSEIFNRSFDCMRIGDKGVKIVRPEDAGFLQKPGTDAEIDTGYDDVEDYDENAVVRRRKNIRL